MIRRTLAVAALATVALTAPTAAAPAAQFSPAYLTPLDPRLANGEQGWQRKPDFTVVWKQAATSQTPTTIAYRVRDGAGTLRLPETRVGWSPENWLKGRVPPQADRYTIELRLGDGELWGPWKSVAFHFDDARPGAVVPTGPGGWIGAGARPTLRVSQPPGPLPFSGVGGYAVAIGPVAGVHPCAAPPLCGPAELDLGGGLGDDELVVPQLDEGVHFASVVAVSGAGLSSEAIGVAALRVDNTVPEVALGGGGEGWVRGPARLRVRASDRLSGMTPAGPAGPFTAIAVDDGPARIAAGDEVEAVVSGDGAHRIEYYARDAAGNVGDGQLRAPPPRAAVIWIDGTPPTVSFTRAGATADPELIEAAVADPLSGPAADRGWIGFRARGEGGAFSPLPTAIEDGVLRARWDSDSHPPGSYEFLATAFDRVGNRATTGRRAGGEPLLLASPLKEPVALRLGFGGRRMVWHRCTRRDGKRQCRRETIVAIDRRPASRRLPYGRRVPVSGRLVDAGGKPLAGRQVTLVETLASGLVRTTQVRSRADGRFFARLAPGPSRRVEAGFGGDRIRSRTASRRLRLVVPAAVRMRGSAATAVVGGAPVRFRGKVGSLAARVPRAGLQVELQFRLPGTGWTEFRTVRTDRRGRFRYEYAFSDDDSRGARFLFRAHVPAQAGWPYAGGSSRPLAITGR